MDEIQPVIGSICEPNRFGIVVLCVDLTTGINFALVRARRITPENGESCIKLAKPTD